MGGKQMGAGNVRAPSEFDCSPRRIRPAADRSKQMKTTRIVWLFIGTLTLIRLSMLPTTDLEFDEAHYWMLAERLGRRFFSKGARIAFAIRASPDIFGNNEFGVRFWHPILAAGTSLLLFYLARRLFSETAGLWS